MYLYANLMFIPAYFSSFSPYFCKYPTKILWFFLKFGQEKKRNCTKIVSLLIFKARSDAVWVYNWGTLPLNLASAKGRAVFIDEARSYAVWVYNWGTLPLTSPLRREGLYSLMKLAPMKCGSIIGARSR